MRPQRPPDVTAEYRTFGRSARTPFHGERSLGRTLDPWQNLWWLCSPAPGQPGPAPGGPVFRTIDTAVRVLS